MKLSAKVVGKTIPLVDNENVKTMGDFIAFQARVSSPESQTKGLNNKRLIDYLIRNKHWSPFECAHLVVEVEAPRDISRQVLRHASARFQEFSQRYSEVQNFTVRELRRQDEKNRQNSIDDFDDGAKAMFERDCQDVINFANTKYKYWLEQGAAKECARVFLPEGLTMSRLYFAAPVRTFLHYLDVREGNGTQLEHIQVANAIREVLQQEEPDLF